MTYDAGCFDDSVQLLLANQDLSLQTNPPNKKARLNFIGHSFRVTKTIPKIFAPPSALLRMERQDNNNTELTVSFALVAEASPE